MFSVYIYDKDTIDKYKNLVLAKYTNFRYNRFTSMSYNVGYQIILKDKIYFMIMPTGIIFNEDGLDHLYNEICELLELKPFEYIFDRYVCIENYTSFEYKPWLCYNHSGLLFSNGKPHIIFYGGSRYNSEYQMHYNSC